MRYPRSMIRFAVVLLGLCLVAGALAQAKPNIVGTWVPAKGQPDPGQILGKLRITFRKDGALDLVGNNVTGKGTYKIAGDKLFIVLTRRNGSKPTNPREKQAQGTIAEKGKVILLPTGERRNGNEVLVRFVRK